MTNIQTSQASGAALDWLVAKCEGHEPWFKSLRPVSLVWLDDFNTARYSTDWSQGGPIIEREKIELEWWHRQELWFASRPMCASYDNQGEYVNDSHHPMFGPTPLVAAMRCFVASKLGDTVEVPEELL